MCYFIAQNEIPARLRLLFDELSRVFKQFSEDLDRVVAAVNCKSAMFGEADEKIIYRVS